MDIFWGTMEYNEVFLQHHASQRHVQDGGDVIPEVGVHLDFIFHRLVIHHLEELRHHWQTLQRAVCLCPKKVWMAGGVCSARPQTMP